MVPVVEAVWVVEVSVLATEFFGTSIHSLRELGNAPIHLLGDGVATVVSTAKHERIGHALYPYSLAWLEVHARFSNGEDVRRSGDDGVWLIVLQHQQAGHDFGGAGGIAGGVFVARPQDLASLCLNYASSLATGGAECHRRYSRSREQDFEK